MFIKLFFLLNLELTHTEYFGEAHLIKVAEKFKLICIHLLNLFPLFLVVQGDRKLLMQGLFLAKNAFSIVLCHEYYISLELLQWSHVLLNITDMLQPHMTGNK